MPNDHPTLPLGARGRLVEAVALAGDLSLRELDRLAGMAESLAYRIATGSRSGMGLETAVSYADVLGLSLDWLAGRGGTPPSEEGVRAAVAEARRRRPRLTGRPGAGRRVLAAVANAMERT